MSKIFESPDGGYTVYEREAGSSQRRLSRGRFKAFPDIAFPDIVNILEAAEHNEPLRKAMEHVILLYHLSKKDGKE